MSIRNYVVASMVGLAGLVGDVKANSVGGPLPIGRNTSVSNVGSTGAGVDYGNLTFGKSSMPMINTSSVNLNRSSFKSEDSNVPSLDVGQPSKTLEYCAYAFTVGFVASFFISVYRKRENDMDFFDSLE